MLRGMAGKATSVDAYLRSLPEDRRKALSAIREVILANLPEGYVECIFCGMIGYVVPHSIYPAGYHCNPSQPLQFAALGSQKNHMTIYLCNVYGDPATEKWFRESYRATGKKLDMGKSCVRFKKLEDLPLEVIGQVIARTPVKKYLARIEQVLQRPGKRRKKNGVQ